MSFFKKLYWCLFRWRIPYASDEELAGVDAIVTQALWKLRDGSSGPGNELLADAIERIHRMYPHKPIMAQDAVAEVLLKRGIRCETIQKSQTEPYANSSLAWNTAEVARRQYDVCKQHSWLSIAFVTAPDHTVRSYLAYLRAGFRRVIALTTDPVQVHYHHLNNIYWAARGARWRYVLREFCARILFLLTGRI